MSNDGGRINYDITTHDTLKKGFTPKKWSCGNNFIGTLLRGENWIRKLLSRNWVSGNNLSESGLVKKNNTAI